MRNTKEIQEQMRCKIGGGIGCVLKKREGGVNGFGYLLRYKAQWKELADYLKECIQYVKFILKKKIIYKKIKLPYYSNMQTFLCQKTPHSLAPSLSLSLFLSFSLFNIPTLITILSTYSLLHSKERYSTLY